MKYVIILEYPDEMPEVHYFDDHEEYARERNYYLLMQDKFKRFDLAYGKVNFMEA